MNKTINILIIEDSLSYAQGMEALLIQQDSVHSVTICLEFNAALEVLKNKPIDVVILDLNFETNTFDGFIIASKIRQQYQSIKIIVLSQHTRKHYYDKLIGEKLADAYLDKQLGIEEVYIALEMVTKGKQYIDKNILAMLEIQQWMLLSKREKEVVELIAKGLTQKEIADQLCIAPKTVEVHIRNLFQRFDVKSSTQLAVRYMRYKNANRENVEDSTAPFKE